MKSRAWASFVRGSYPSRALALGLSFLAVAPMLRQMDAPWWQWVLYALHAFLWPYAAWRLSARSAAPAEAGRRNLLIDHFAAGWWAAGIAFNALLSVLMLALLLMDSMIAGGWRQFLRGLALHAAGAVFGLLLFGMDWQPESSADEIWACLPLLLVYPAMAGRIAYLALRELREQREDLSQLSLHDALSGLHNRRHMDAVIQAEFQRYRRHAEPAALVLIDFDHFKRINDDLGHPVGDKAIRQFAKRLQTSLRSSDTPGRYGGEEFVVLMPHTSARNAGLFMRRLQQNIRDEPLLEERPVTVSIGIAALSPELDSHGAWLKLADAMLYRAKDQGRNCVVIAGDDAPDPPSAEPPRGAQALLPLERRLMVGLELGNIAAAIFDPSDRMAWANEAFRRLYCVPPKARTFADIIHNCYRLRCGPRIDTQSLRTWLSIADAQRRRQPHRSFLQPMHDGNVYRVEETLMANGWLLNLWLPHHREDDASEQLHAVADGVDPLAADRQQLGQAFDE
ncbi:diguanylate cyclase [Bordetella genomosp. 13]|uniref:diguanylate cyclase n=1 Tax=Bordetella genomosp. 13 TaxID=463040 RepID=UPI0016434540|nr:diguanylate cyclase [Bordetella genomosp. 13]